MHYYKRNIGDYAKKAGRLSMLEHGAYTLLIDACYDRERFPNEQEAIEWAWARSDAEIEAVRFVLSRFFVLIDGVYVQERIKEEIDAFARNSEINARIARDREEKRTKRSRSVNEASPSEHEPPPNHKPLTTNQEPLTKLNRTRKARSQPSGSLSVEDLVAEGVSERHAIDWMRVRKDKGAKSLTQTAWLLVKTEAAKAGLSPAQAVEMSAANSWQGFKAEWVKPQSTTGPGRHLERPLTPSERAAYASTPSICSERVRRLMEQEQKSGQQAVIEMEVGHVAAISMD